MSEKLRVQRNERDVALELTKLYKENFKIENPEDLEKQYAKFYALVTYLEADPQGLLFELVPEEIITKLNK